MRPNEQVMTHRPTELSIAFVIRGNIVGVWMRACLVAKRRVELASASISRL